MADHFDVVIVGAGISGIGVAHYLRTAHPQRSVAVIEARTEIGGTWDLFRYPGVRSDSDLFTFGYEFRPWTGESIASGEAIRAYLKQVVDDDRLRPSIRFSQQVTQAHWDSSARRWTITTRDVDTGASGTLTADWLVLASGYYRYDAAHQPDFPGSKDFAGPIIHPQFWPEDLDYSGQNVVVIGSGATAVTLVPALTEKAKHVTMLQRTPTYVVPVPAVDRSAQRLQRLLGPHRAHRLVRRRNIARQRLIWIISRKRPQLIRRLIRWTNQRALPKGYPVDTDFRPPYDPWDQRLCVARDGDLFRAISNGSASVVTGQVQRFVPEGVELTCGRTLPADLVVTATGLQVQPFGGAALFVDGQPVDVPTTLAFKGMMLSNVPNLAYIVGYTNSSWTLKVGLLSTHLNALLSHMDDKQFDVCVPRPADPGMPTRPFLDFAAGYIQRVRYQLPRQGDRWPWLTSMDYYSDRRLLKADRVADPELEFWPAERTGSSDIGRATASSSRHPAPRSRAADTEVQR